MKTKTYIIGGTEFVFIDTNPFSNHTMEQVMPLLTQEQADFINSKNWSDEQKLRRAQEFAEENQCSSQEE